MMRTPTTKQPARHATIASALTFLGVCAISLPWTNVPSVSTLVDPQVAQLRFNPNTASRTELMLLPGIGSRLSARIIAYRQAVPTPSAFSRADDLALVQGIGSVAVEKLRPYLYFEESQTTQSGAP
ncbi:MAG: helix-hairpin-helix domain-containing protein [Planctomycetota bacterium]